MNKHRKLTAIQSIKTKTTISLYQSESNIFSISIETKKISNHTVLDNNYLIS